MASIEEVYNVIHKIAIGIENECAACLDDNKNVVEGLIREQLDSGQNGKGKLLNPTYDNDPFFEEPGHWYHRKKAYKHWKKSITPPKVSEVLYLSPRPVEVPNLFITGSFHDSITAKLIADGINVDTEGFIDGPDIKNKYGEEIFLLGEAGKKYFTDYILRPWLKKFIINSGYK